MLVILFLGAGGIARGSLNRRLMALMPPASLLIGRPDFGDEPA
jgi:hypothetical protein